MVAFIVPTVAFIDLAVALCMVFKNGVISRVVQHGSCNFTCPPELLFEKLILDLGLGLRIASVALHRHHE